MIKQTLWRRGYVLAILLACTPGLSHQLLAQDVQQAPPPATSQPQPATPQTQGKPSNDSGNTPSQPAPPKKQPPQNDRIFFALPNYLTVENASNLPPLTTREKFKTVAEGCFDPVEVVFIGIQAGIDQGVNADPTYHQGMLGYSKRFGTDYADAIIGNFGTGAIFPTLLRQDPRYYQMGKGNFFRRFGYAAIRVLITRSDRSGKTEFNFSEFFGNGMAAGLSNAYHPGPHTLASSADVEGTQYLMDIAGYELKEFWPDLRRAILRAKHQP